MTKGFLDNFVIELLMLAGAANVQFRGAQGEMMNGSFASKVMIE
jgi:hypothetical protein